jgi:DNA repair protein RadC
VTNAGDARQISLLPPDGATILHLIRENLRLLGELATHYEVPGLDAALDGPAMRSPPDVAAYLGPELVHLAQEQLRVVLVDTKNRVIATQLIYQGGINATSIRLADCFREAVARGAAAIILAHNHPSGDPTPSPEDVRLTQEAGHLGDLLGIELLDHIVIGRQGHVSLRERGLYTPPSRDGTQTGPSVSDPGGLTYA